MATITSAGSGNWATAGTWDAGVPADGDDVVIASGHTVTFDANQSAFVTGVKVTITGKLDFTRTAGAYCLRPKADANAISGTGYFECGTVDSPIPSTVVHKIIPVGSTALCKIGYASGKLVMVGTEPTIRVVKTVNNKAIGNTRIEIDQDISADLWSVGDRVTISANSSTNSCKSYTIAAKTSTYIDLTSGLTVANTAGSYVVLCNRNVHVEHTTANRFFQAGGYFKNISVDTSMGGSSTSTSNSHAVIIGGVYTKSAFNFSNDNSTAEGAIFTMSTSIPDAMVKNCDFYGCTDSSSGTRYLNCRFYGSGNLGSRNRFWSCYAEYSSFYTTDNEIHDSDIGTGVYQFTWNVPRNLTLINCKTGNSGVNNINLILETNFVESIDHEQISGAYKLWTIGGITTSQTSVLPSGYVLAYLTTTNNAYNRAWHRHKVFVPAGSSATVDVQLRKDASMEYLPRAYLSEIYESPFLDIVSAVDSFTMTDSTDTWESHTFTIDNSAGTTDKDYTLWFMAKNATGNVYSAYDITTQGGTGGSVKILPATGGIRL